MTLVEFSIIPVGNGESISRWVFRAVDIVDRSGLKYQLGPMGTCIEGEWEDISRVIGECLCEIGRECNRVAMTLKLDHRRGASHSLQHHVLAIRQNLGHQIPTAS